ncbi:jeltraxin-like [Leptodactylus fuscus]|uniref:jeltraxin-like n=1 Tax=Leptodactylus fuscus TaxID=238119 RepID=UPI003F4EFADA
MKNFPILFVLLFSGCFAQKDKIIIFPRQTATDHVILKPTVDKPLKQLSVCLRSYTDLTREHSLLSIAIPGSGKDNAFIIYPKPPNICHVFINQEEITFMVDPEVLAWKHTCVTWDSETGLVQLWINGKKYPRKGTNKGPPIGPEMCVVIGQEQDNMCGGFEVGQSFVGEIRDVHMWSYVLDPQSLRRFSTGYDIVGGNIFNWISGTTEIKGGVLEVEAAST